MSDDDLDLEVTPEFFDYLQSEAMRPARTPDPEMVERIRWARTHSPAEIVERQKRERRERAEQAAARWQS